jgi:hypothetical protein
VVAGKHVVLTWSASAYRMRTQKQGIGKEESEMANVSTMFDKIWGIPQIAAFPGRRRRATT